MLIHVTQIFLILQVNWVKTRETCREKQKHDKVRKEVPYLAALDPFLAS